MPSAAATPAPPASEHLPYGEQQGSFRGVVACSNRDDGYFSGENNYVSNAIYTGYRYQCVEYARRFLLLTTGCVFGSCGRASEIFAMDHITNVETGETHPLHHHQNDGTSEQRPQPGDIIIYPFHPELTPWGHVGVISYVTDTCVGIAEQNQFFGPFISPDPAYLGGERCVARYADLHCDPEKKTWTIVDASPMPQCTGWLSYPDAPVREQIYAPFSPQPEAIRDRATPFDHPEHPFITHYHLNTGLDIPSGRVGHAYGMRSGSAETLVGATTATARALRLTLQFLFHRKRLGLAFRTLPTNPLNAPMPSGAEAKTRMCYDLDRLLRPFCDPVLIANDAADTSAALLQAVAEYFNIPLEWVQAMQREFARGEIHLAAALSFYPNIAKAPEELEKFHSLHQNAKSAVSPVDPTSPSSPDCNSPSMSCPAVNTLPGMIENMPLKNPHDEAWCLGKTNFGNMRLLAELAHLAGVADELKDALGMLTPSMRSFMSTQYRMDFAAYLKMVETVRGPRTAFTIVLSDDYPMDGLLRELLSIMQSLCEQFKYPVCVVNEKDLHFSDGKLMTAPSEASPTPSSPATSITPKGPYEVNFVYAFCEWPEILEDKGEKHAALYNAAVDPASDVVFAKPLWSYLCSGMLNVNDVNEDGTVANPGMRSRSVRFYDIVRRLYLFASPKQPFEAWDQEVSEFKDSCRRIHMDTPSIPLNPPGLLRGESAMVNLATSCYMAHIGGLLHPDDDNCGKHDGHPSALSFMFPSD